MSSRPGCRCLVHNVTLCTVSTNWSSTYCSFVGVEPTLARLVSLQGRVEGVGSEGGIWPTLNVIKRRPGETCKTQGTTTTYQCTTPLHYRHKPNTLKGELPMRVLCLAHRPPWRCFKLSCILSLTRYISYSGTHSATARRCDHGRRALCARELQGVGVTKRPFILPFSARSLEHL